MTILLQVSSVPLAGAGALGKPPTFQEIVTIYGPYLGLILILLIAIMVAQFIWYGKLNKAKDDQIANLNKLVEDLHRQVMKFIDSERKKKG